MEKHRYPVYHGTKTVLLRQRNCLQMLELIFSIKTSRLIITSKHNYYSIIIFILLQDFLQSACSGGCSKSVSFLLKSGAKADPIALKTALSWGYEYAFSHSGTPLNKYPQWQTFASWSTILNVGNVSPQTLKSRHNAIPYNGHFIWSHLSLCNSKINDLTQWTVGYTQIGKCQ